MGTGVEAAARYESPGAVQEDAEQDGEERAGEEEAHAAGAHHAGVHDAGQLPAAQPCESPRAEVPSRGCAGHSGPGLADDGSAAVVSSLACDPCRGADEAGIAAQASPSMPNMASPSYTSSSGAPGVMSESL